VAALGRPERTARRMGLMGVCGKVAGILSPLVVGSVLFREMDNLEASIQLAEGVSRAAELDTLAHKAVLPYLVIMLALAALAVVVRFSPLPNVNAEGRRQAAGVRRRKLLRFPRFWFGLLALALCVGVEVVAVDTIVLYGKSVGLSFQVAKAFPAYPLLAMALGYLLGAAATPRYVSQEQAPALCALSGIVFSLLAINTGGGLSIAFISLLGLSNALLWPTIFSLSLRGLGKLTQLGAAILATATVGGAVVPLAYGHLADSVGNRQAYWLLVPCYVLILLFAIMSSGKERQQGQKGD
jgi:glucose/galactose transporter